MFIEPALTSGAPSVKEGHVDVPTPSKLMHAGSNRLIFNDPHFRADLALLAEGARNDTFRSYKLALLAEGARNATLRSYKHGPPSGGREKRHPSEL